MNYVESITWPATQTNGQPCPNAPNPCGSWDIVGSGLRPRHGRVSHPLHPASNCHSPVERRPESARTPHWQPLAHPSISRAPWKLLCFPPSSSAYFAMATATISPVQPLISAAASTPTETCFSLQASTLTFTDKIAAVGQIILDQLENGHSTAAGYGGSVYAPNAAGGCPAAPLAGPAANCPQLTAGSWSGGIPTSWWRQWRMDGHLHRHVSQLRYQRTDRRNHAAVTLREGVCRGPDRHHSQATSLR